MPWVFIEPLGYSSSLKVLQFLHWCVAWLVPWLAGLAPSSPSPLIFFLAFSWVLLPFLISNCFLVKYHKYHTSLRLMNDQLSCVLTNSPIQFGTHLFAFQKLWMVSKIWPTQPHFFGSVFQILKGGATNNPVRSLVDRAQSEQQQEEYGQTANGLFSNKDCLCAKIKCRKISTAAICFLYHTLFNLLVVYSMLGRYMLHHLRSWCCKPHPIYTRCGGDTCQIIVQASKMYHAEVNWSVPPGGNAQ